MAARKRTGRELHHELRRLADSSPVDADRAVLLHEVQVYQEELAVQNEALREMQSVLEEARDRFIELYDFAPNGYATLDGHGVVRQVNLTAVSWLGRSKQAVEGMPFLGFVEVADREAWMDFLRRCREQQSDAAVTARLALRTPDGTRHVEMLCRPTHTARPRSDTYLTTILDLTEQLHLQAEGAEAARARLALAGRLISIQEDERQRMARDLHDNVGQQLIALRMKLEALLVESEVQTGLRSHIREAVEGFHALDQALDFMAAELRPAGLDIGFIPALVEFVKEWSRTFSIPVHFESRSADALRPPPAVATHLFRIVQEALNNVYKHASARKVRVALQRSRDDLLMTIEDDGVGFVPGTTAKGPTRGIGLLSMTERAALIGARFAVRSARTTGTVVSVRVPGVWRGWCF